MTTLRTALNGIQNGAQAIVHLTAIGYDVDRTNVLTISQRPAAPPPSATSQANRYRPHVMPLGWDRVKKAAATAAVVPPANPPASPAATAPAPAATAPAPAATAPAPAATQPHTA